MNSHRDGSPLMGRPPSFIRRDDALLVATRVVERKMDPYLGFSLLGMIATGLPEIAALEYFRRSGDPTYLPCVSQARASEIIAACATLLLALDEKSGDSSPRSLCSEAGQCDFGT
jgi:hypothetical protein